MEEPAASPDLAIGSYSERGPWVVDPDAMPWRADVARRRALARAQFPPWLPPRPFPPPDRGRVWLSPAGSTPPLPPRPDGSRAPSAGSAVRSPPGTSPTGGAAPRRAG